MKLLPIAVASVALAACATTPESETTAGTSQKPPAEVTQCIAQQWAAATQQPVTIQTRIANDQGADVLLPGQPPGGSAAVVRPAYTSAGTWVGLRTVGSATLPPSASAAVNACL